LCGISYVEELRTHIATIKASIIRELKHKKYATQGKWSLVWGPALYKPTQNLIYVARQGAQSSQFAIVLRGTSESARSVWEDIPDGQSPFPFTGTTPTSVSGKFNAAFTGMMATPDPATGLTLAQFMASQAAKLHGITVTATGHSQGGGLATMLLAWLLTQAKTWKNTGGRLITGYAFAAVSAGNPAFAQWMSANTNLFRVVNPLDIIPYLYQDVGGIKRDQVPEKNPGGIDNDLIAAAIDLLEADAWEYGPWQQPATLELLRKVQLPGTIGYADQIENQHTGNSYLYLLGAPQLDFDTKSLLPNYG
jgi:hypothetical protein